VVLAAAVLFAVNFVTQDWGYYRAATPDRPAMYGDFFALWSYGAVLSRFPATDVYQATVLQAHQLDWGASQTGPAPCPYPPLALPALRLLAVLPYNVSFLVFEALSALFLTTVVAAVVTRAIPAWIFILMAPASVISLIGGQTGLYVAGLMTLTLTLARSRPWVAGLALGAMAFKPQLAILLPVVLVAWGAWSVLAAGATVALASAVLATGLYGWSIWPAWLACLPTYAAQFARQANILPLQPSLVGNLEALGWFGPGPLLFQIVALIVCIAATWRIARRGTPGAVLAVVFAGTFVATPHALLYDMPVVTVGIVAWVKERFRFGLTAWQVAIVTVTYLMPMYMISTLPFVPVTWGLCAALLLTLLRDAPSGPIPSVPGTP
jgi:hypothetical protein